jgi:single-strand DNA-binding protein
MASFNSCTIIGNLCRDPELRYTPNGTAVCEISVAVNESYKNAAGEKVDTVMFLDVVCWGRTAELVVQYLTKGVAALFDGKLKQETWEDKEGAKRSKIKMTCERMILLGSKGGGNGSGGRTYSDADAPASATRSSEPASSGAASSPPDDGIPFTWLLPFVVAAAASLLA